MYLGKQEQDRGRHPLAVLLSDQFVEETGLEEKWTGFSLEKTCGKVALLNVAKASCIKKKTKTSLQCYLQWRK